MDAIDAAMFSYHAHLNAQFLLSILSGVERRDTCFLVKHLCEFLATMIPNQVSRYLYYLEHRIDPETVFGVELHILDEKWEEWKRES